MKKLLHILALLFSFNGWADSFIYDGNDYDECMTKAGDASNQNSDTYSEYINVCREIGYKKSEERRISMQEEKQRLETAQKKIKVETKKSDITKKKTTVKKKPLTTKKK